MPEETTKHILIEEETLSEDENRLDIFRDRRGECHRVLCIAEPCIEASKGQRKVHAMQIEVPGREQKLFVEPAEGIREEIGRLGHPLVAMEGDVSHPLVSS